MREEREVSLHVERSGRGRAVVLAHGFGGSARNFRGQVRALSARATFVLFDQRGHARSGAPRDPALYTAAHLVDDFASVVERFVPPGERAVVGGVSLGAAIGLGYARRRPDRVAGLVLAAFPPGADEPRVAGDAPGTASQADWARAFADAIDREGLEAAGDEYAWGPRSGFDPAAARLVRQGFLEHPPHGVRNLLRGVLALQPGAATLAPSLRRLDVPALVIVGGADALSLGPSRILARALPRARLVVVEGAGHVVNLAAPAAFNAALEELLDEVDRADARHAGGLG